MGENKKKQGIKLPHVYLMLTGVMLFVVLLSFFVPSGEMDRVYDARSDKMVVDPSSYHRVDDVERITVMDFFESLHLGMKASVDIAIMLCIAGGAIYIVEQSGAIQAGIQALLKISTGKETAIIVLLMLTFSSLGAAGISEETIPMIPLIISVVVGMGYDKFVGVGIVMLSIAIGFSSGVLNIYTTGVAQGLVGLPTFSGSSFRVTGFIIFNLITILYILNYAKKIKKDPSLSLCSEHSNGGYESNISAEEEMIEFTTPMKIVLAVMVFIFIFQAIGAIKWGWGLSNISALYTMFVVFAAIVLKIKPNDACRQFATGASGLFPTCITMGLARAVMVLMEQVKIIDTAIYGISNTLGNFKPFTILFLVYLIVIVFNFFVTSGSGKAVILMPLLEPLGEMVGINQQVMVLMFNYGDGLTNYFWPTAATLMGCLGVAGIEWVDWVKFSGKLFAMLISAAFAMIVVAHYINLGPF